MDVQGNVGAWNHSDRPRGRELPVCRVDGSRIASHDPKVPLTCCFIPAIGLWVEASWTREMDMQLFIVLGIIVWGLVYNDTHITFSFFLLLALYSSDENRLCMTLLPSPWVSKISYCCLNVSVKSWCLGGGTS